MTRETTRSFIMLTVTDNAVAVIRNLTGQQQVPDGAGLRIATDPSAGSLTLSLAPEPQEGDQVLDASGARLFLDSEAAQLLDDKALDAAVDAAGTVQFAVAEQPG
jgi:iron-sulfur cluster assembly protein